MLLRTRKGIGIAVYGATESDKETSTANAYMIASMKKDCCFGCAETNKEKNTLVRGLKCVDMRTAAHTWGNIIFFLRNIANVCLLTY